MSVDKVAKEKADYKIGFHVPESHVEIVKMAMFEAGAGKIGDYDCCAWQTLGVGQFRALDGANPFIGNKNVIETVKEYRVEMVCTKTHIKEVIQAFRKAHPYEEPAFDIVELLDF